MGSILSAVVSLFAFRFRSRCVCRQPRPFDLVTESLNVGHDARADILPFEPGCLAFLSENSIRDGIRRGRQKLRMIGADARDPLPAWDVLHRLV
jgi:hypothetical protein